MMNNIKTIICILLTCLVITANAQSELNSQKESDTQSEADTQQEADVKEELDTSDPFDDVYTMVEKMPMFPGCTQLDYLERKNCSEKLMLEFIYHNIQYPENARKNGIEGMIVISFVVDKDGSILDAKILRNLGGGCGEEALRVINSFPKWNPGIQRGKPVMVQFNLPVRFKLTTPAKKKKKMRG